MSKSTSDLRVGIAQSRVLQFEVEQLDLERAFGVVASIGNISRVRLSLSNSSLRFIVARTHLHCESQANILLASDKPDDWSVDYDVSASLVSELLCSDKIQKNFLSNARVRFMIDEQDVSSNNSPSRDCKAEIRRGSLAIRWVFSAKASISSQLPSAVGAKVVPQPISEALRTAFEVVDRRADERFQAVELANQMARAGSPEAFRTVTSGSYPELDICVDRSCAPSFAALLRHMDPHNTRTWIQEAHQYFFDDHVRCSVSRHAHPLPELSQPSSTLITFTLELIELYAGIYRICSQTGSTGSILITVEVGAECKLVLSTRVRGGDAKVEMLVTAAEVHSCSVGSVITAVISADGLMKIEKGVGSSFKVTVLSFHPGVLAVVSEADSVCVKTIIPFRGELELHAPSGANEGLECDSRQS